MDAAVAVIGLGPTGATLANLLGLLGIDVIALDLRSEVSQAPRAVHFDGECMRIFQTIGVAGAVASVSRINQGMRFVDPDGRLILDWPRPQEEGPMGWHPSWRFHQPELEAILEDRIAAWPSVRVRTGARVEEVVEDQHAITLVLASGERLRVSWVIGCDGARSTVRRAVGGGMQDLGFHERWLVVDAVLERERADLGDHTLQYCHPRHPATYVRGPGARRRWEVALGEETDEEALRPDAVAERLSRWLAPGDARIERAVVYTFHSVIAKRWRAGRLMIAGDAAHQTPPFMGQGMCAGIRDAANLAWKIASVVRDGANETLLDSYQSERAMNVRAYVEGAIRLGRLINASDPQGALESAFRQSDGSYRMSSLDVGLGPGLHEAGGGWLFPQLRLSPVERMDDAIGFGPAILTHAPLGPEADRRAHAAGIVTLRADAYRDLPDLDEDVTLIRPDRYVFGTSMIEDAAGLIARYVSATTGRQKERPVPGVAGADGK